MCATYHTTTFLNLLVFDDRSLNACAAKKHYEQEHRARYVDMHAFYELQTHVQHQTSLSKNTLMSYLSLLLCLQEVNLWSPN